MKTTVILLVILFICGCGLENKTFNHKRYFYKLLNADGEINSYAIRDYFFNQDSIREETFFLNKEGVKLDERSKVFIIKKGSLKIIIKNDVQTLIPNLNKHKADSCNTYLHPLHGNIQYCFKGKVAFGGFKDIYKVQYIQNEIDGAEKMVYFDNDFTYVGMSDVYVLGFSIEKEIRITEEETPVEIRKSIP